MEFSAATNSSKRPDQQELANHFKMLLEDEESAVRYENRPRTDQHVELTIEELHKSLNSMKENEAAQSRWAEDGGPNECR